MSISKRVKIIMPDEKTQAARQREVDERAPWVTVETIRFDPASDSIGLVMQSGIKLSIPRSLVEELDDITTDDLRNIRIGAGGDVIELDDLDIHIYAPGLFRDLLGLNAGQRVGGRSRSAAKIKAARANGASGGRPRKPVAK